MSQLPPHAIDEFQNLWQQHYGRDLPREQAVVRAHQVFTLVRLLVETPPAQTNHEANSPVSPHAPSAETDPATPSMDDDLAEK